MDTKYYTCGHCQDEEVEDWDYDLEFGLCSSCCDMMRLVNHVNMEVRLQEAKTEQAIWDDR